MTTCQKVGKPTFLLLLTISICGLELLLDQAARAQQSTTAPTNAQPRRPRTTFFEQERRPRFGFGDFLESALDGSQNVFADTAKVSNYRLDPLSDITVGPISGTFTVTNRNQDSANFLVSNFTNPGTATNITFSNIQTGSTPQLGTLTINGTINGQPVSGTRNYNAGFSQRGDTVSGVILVTDPANPSNSVFINLPPQLVPGAGDTSQPISSPASLTFGLPTDR
ncbi:MAG: hypothetical protein VKL00_10060 [Synechococcales bacterium]|nr:hypothetical protein [Synechococcales bacterium]